MNVGEKMGERKKIVQNRFQSNAENWMKIHKSVHEKVAAVDDGTLLCTFLKCG